MRSSQSSLENSPVGLPDASAPSPRRVLLALGVTIGSFIILQSLLIPVLPVMQQDLGTDTAGITWALTIWLITAAVATPVFGRIGDLAGKRRTFLLLAIAVVAGSVVAAVAPNLGILLLGRVLQGFGGAMFPLAFGLVRDALPADRVASGIGVLAAINAIGSGLGTVFAGPLATYLSWRGLFLVPLIGVSIGAVLVIRSVPATSVRAPGRINLPAATLLSLGLVALLLPLSLGSSWGWGSPLVIGLFVAAALLLAGWIVVELRSREPLVDMRMMRLPGVWNANVAAILIGAAMFGVWAFLARFLEEPTSTGYGLGATVGEAGLVMLPMLALMAVAGFFVAPISRIIDSRGQVVAGSLMIGLSTAAIAFFHSEVWEVAVASAVFGMGLGMVSAAMANVIVQSVPATQTGIATGMNANLRMIGAGVGTSLMTAIVTGSATGSSATAQPTEAGYEIGFLVLAALGVLAAGIAALTRRSRRTAPAEELEPIAESPFVGAEAEVA